MSSNMFEKKYYQPLKISWFLWHTYDCCLSLQTSPITQPTVCYKHNTDDHILFSKQ